MSATQVTSSTTAVGVRAVERCDRCGAGAKVRVLLARGGELLFCGHHARTHEDKLRQVAVALRSIG
ncbi:MAG: hypothetical protein JO100_18000 [Pseudonocardia sp.]|nr:hypothetical protein [Pseudonocardia sp.]